MHASATKTNDDEPAANFILNINADFQDDCNTLRDLIDPLMPPEIVLLNITSDLMDTE